MPGEEGIWEVGIYFPTRRAPLQGRRILTNPNTNGVFGAIQMAVHFKEIQIEVLRKGAEDISTPTRHAADP